jgi:aryl-alcohol dehydrogenase-like predicted oxidoreductase
VFQAENSPQRTAILDTLIAVAKDTGVSPAEIAIGVPVCSFWNESSR